MIKYLTNISKKDLKELTKFKLSVLNTISASCGQMLANNPITSMDYTLFVSGTLLMSMASQTSGQVIERDRDKLMLRCSGRPLVTKSITPQQATAIATLLYSSSNLTYLLMSTNSIPTLLMSNAVFYFYLLGQLPLKTRSELNMTMGALVGSLPPLVGACASLGYSGIVNIDVLNLFFQTLGWQQPHFQAIAQKQKDDQKNAGFITFMDNVNKNKGLQGILGGLSVQMMSLLSMHYQSMNQLYLLPELHLIQCQKVAFTDWPKDYKNVKMQGQINMLLLYIVILSTQQCKFKNKINEIRDWLQKR